MARGVHDIDVRVVPGDRAILGQDGDSTLLFQVIAVHDPLGHLFVVTERAALSQQLVHESGFAMVHVGDDGDISDLFIHQIFQATKA